MTRAAVYLTDQTASIGQLDLDRRPDGRSARAVVAGMTFDDQGLAIRLRANSLPQVQTEERAGVGSGVSEKEGWLPLVRQREVETAVAVDVRQSDAAGDHRCAQSQLT